MSAAAHDFVYRVTTAEAIRDLRHRVLIAGTERTDAAFEGDDHPDTRHFGGFGPSPAGRCVACVSYMRADIEGEPAYQLRGMAVERDLRGRGIGSALLRWAEARLLEQTPARLFRCNARIGAVGFYERHGWYVVSDVFEIEGVGPHRRLVKRLFQASD